MLTRLFHLFSPPHTSTVDLILALTLFPQSFSSFPVVVPSTNDIIFSSQSDFLYKCPSPPLQ